MGAMGALGVSTSSALADRGPATRTGFATRTRERARAEGTTDYEQTEGTWSRWPPMPDRRTEVGAAVLDGELYVVGGFVPDGVTAGVAVFDPMAERGAATAGEWRTADPLPEPRHHAAVVALGSDLYVVGGFRGRGFDPVDSVWCYDGSEWQERTTLPAPRGALTAQAIDGKVYAVGGEGPDGSVATLTVYDPTADEWDERSPMPTARNHLASGAVGGRLYAVGGRTSFSNLLGANEAYDLDADEWTELTPMPTPRGGLAGTSLRDRVVAVGGEGPGGTFEEVEAYDLERDEWQALPPLPTPRHGLGAAVIDGDLYTVAGGPEPGFAFSNVLEVFRSEGAEITTTEGG